ncbi:MAG TPA: AAA family ATPase [bacterium]|nr:AAA family ATPase [bacterium]
MNQTSHLIDQKIDINSDFIHALDRIEHAQSPLYITGQAGTGKSTLLKHFRANTNKKIVVAAPTGIAALNVGGQTIHSLFGFSSNVTPNEIKNSHLQKSRQKLFRQMEILIIDEISMVRADLMDCIDESLRCHLKNDLPFGGKQIVMFGDLYQLPPVISSQEEREIFRTVYPSPFFFDAKIFIQLPIERIELKKIFRQNDQKFINLLNNIRHNQISDHDLNLLNSCYQPNSFDSDEGYITLCTTNQTANEINNFKLSQLPGKPSTYSGTINGDFNQNNLPTEFVLSIKINAQIMMLTNDPAGRWVNGSMGQVVDIVTDCKTHQDILIVEIFGEKLVEVTPHTWEASRFYYDTDTQAINFDVAGSFTQYPLRLAWAITIHKSQGKTFDKVIIDIGRGSFSAGQVYVAVSRATSLDGLILKKPILKRHIWTDPQIVNFMNGGQPSNSNVDHSAQNKIDIIQKAIDNYDTLKIVYLKPDNTKSNREIKPQYVGEVEFFGQKYIGVEAYCLERKAIRQFKLDRIIQIG